MKAKLYGLVLVLVLSLQLDRAHADGADELPMPSNIEAHEHLTKGARLANRIHDYRGALEEYKAGLLIEDAPAFYYNSAVAYRKLEQCDLAIWNYEHFLTHTSPLPETFKKNSEAGVSECKTLIERSKEAKESANAKVVATSPPSEPWYADGVGWTVTGIGVAGIVTSSVLLVQASNYDNDANHEPNVTQQAALRDSANSRRLAGEIIGVTAVLTLGVGIVKLVVTPSAPTSTVASSLQLGITSNSLFVAGRF